MKSPNVVLRDPVLYRIKHVTHHRTGDTWCIYPMYDYTHCISDALEGVTHSLCSLEFENNRPLYDWVLDNLPVPGHPQQIEFARLNLSYTVLSKRKLIQLVTEKLVSGWDDPRLPTLSGIRRRGYTPEAIRDFCERIGISKAENMALLSNILELSKIESGTLEMACIPFDPAAVERQALDMIIIEIRDDGPGLPEGLDLAQTTSLGLQLVSNLARQLRGDISARNDGGAVFILRFPRQSA